MKLWFRHCDPLVVLFCVLGLGPISANAGLIVGIDFGNSQQEHILAIGPLTGNITSLPTVASDAYIVTSSAPAANSILVDSVNLYQLNVATGQTSLYACVQALCPWVEDLAYDSSDGVVYGLVTPPGGAEGLVQLNDSGVPYPGIPGSHWISYSWIGELGVAGISVIEFVPGLGLYGVANGNTPAGFTINVTTGQATFLAPLSEPVFPYGVTGLAYDPETGRLLASSGTLGGIGSGPPGAIFLLDPGNGLVTPLNVDAPNLYGIAYVGTLEPGPAWMLLVGLTACFAIRRFRRLCH